MKRCREFIVTDHNNIYYTDCKGNKVYDVRKKDELIMLDVTKPFSDNLKQTISTPILKRSFVEYLKSDIRTFISLNLVCPLLAIVSFAEGAPFMGGFALTVLITYYVGSLIDWKRRG